MQKLYTIVGKDDIAAVVSGARLLSDLLCAADGGENSKAELVDTPSVPNKLGASVIEVSFGSSETLVPYLLQIMDAPTTYALSAEMLDQGRVRALSEAEMNAIARGQIRLCVPPSSMRLWEFIDHCPVEERLQRFGPYLMRAYVEFREDGSSPASGGSQFLSDTD